jgi:hypothetical protein
VKRLLLTIPILLVIVFLFFLVFLNKENEKLGLNNLKITCSEEKTCKINEVKFKTAAVLVNNLCKLDNNGFLGTEQLNIVLKKEGKGKFGGYSFDGTSMSYDFNRTDKSVGVIFYYNGDFYKNKNIEKIVSALIVSDFLEISRENKICRNLSIKVIRFGFNFITN